MRLVPDAITQTIARNGLLLQKNSPEVLFAVGTVGMVGSTVLACRATLKMDGVLEESQAKLRQSRDMAASDEFATYTKSDSKHDVRLIRVQTSMKIVKLYAPAIIVGGLSIAALTTSHRTLSKRNAALAAAYTALDKGFRQYRARVIEKYGDEEDQHFRYGTEQVEVVNDQGKKELVTRVSPDAGGSIYARFFDRLCPDWGPNPEYNLIFLKCQQNWANDMLHARGHVFLNEVYDHLGLKRSKAGSVVGWVLSKDSKSDNYISFGVFEGQDQTARDFVNGFEGSILLDFNVDGLIWDQIEEIGEEISWQQGH